MRKELAQRYVKITNSQLRHHNDLLRKNLRRVVSYSTENEDVQKRIDEMNDLIFAASSMKAMFDILVTQGRRIFDLDVITVTLAEKLKEHYPADYQKNGKNIYLESKFILFHDPEALSAHFTDFKEPVLRGGLGKSSEMFFPNGLSRKTRSEALTPIYYNNKITGVVAYGSSNPTRFMEGYGSRFIKRLAVTLSLKVEIFCARAIKVK